MSLSMKWISIPLAAMISTACLASPAPKEESSIYSCTIKTHKSLTYGTAQTTTGEKDLYLDLYLPTGSAKSCKGKHPTLLLIHGGGFTSGTRKQEEIVDIAQDYAAAGFAVAAIDYRLLTKTSQPVIDKNGKLIAKTFYQGALDNNIDFYDGRFEQNPALALAMSGAAAAAALDAYQAVQWLDKQKKRYSLNMKKLSFAGGSAGAITAMNLAYLLPELRAYKGPKPRVVIDLWGALTQIDSLDKHKPSLFIVHGTKDKTVPFSASTLLVDRAQEEKVGLAFYPIKGAKHSFKSIPVATIEVDGMTLQERMIRFTAREQGIKLGR